METKRRIHIPPIVGEYGLEDQILARAREYFLIVIQAHTPRPLYVLRDRVLPKYRIAFATMKSLAIPLAKVTELVHTALLDAILPGETDADHGAPNATRAIEMASLNEASASLVNWSKQSNLQGHVPKIKQPTVGIEIDRAISAWMWPYTIGLNTILHWHFAPSGWLWERRDPPHWRPPLHLFKPSTFVPESLPEIRLRAVVPWSPTSEEERAFVRARDAKFHRRLIRAFEQGFRVTDDHVTQIVTSIQAELTRFPKSVEVDTYDWALELETEVGFRERIHENLDVWLDRHIDERRKVAAGDGFMEAPRPQNPTAFEWAAKYQIEGMTSSQIAEECRLKGHHITKHSVEKAIYSVLDSLLLERRPPKRGPKRNRALTVKSSPRHLR